MRTTPMNRTARLLVSLAVIAALALPATAGELRPFKGRATEAITSAAPGPEGLEVTTTGSGLATHLGLFSREVTAVLHGDGTVEGTVVFTAANGDQLTAELDGGFTSPTTLAGTYTFTGGTGRFSDAAGSATFEGFTTDGIHIALTFEGGIDY